jgi:NAD(P)-dependent dehydrogenase (short-subunit alcohol dehydrogenase family)
LSSVPPPERIAVVTGTSSGIGEAVALRLGRAGWRVLAGVRRQEDAERLEDRGLQPVWLDVTDADSIAAAAVELGERPLAGLVNNAGVAVSMPLELLPLDELRRQLEINLVGQVAVTQAFLPALRRGRGRLVFVGSIAGRSALPFLGAYAASKHALEAVTDSLRIELRPFGIEVAVVEPGTIGTPIWTKGAATFQRIAASLPDGALGAYADRLAAFREAGTAAGRRGEPAEKVAQAVEHALTAERPRTRYVVGRDAKRRVRVERLPDRWRDRVYERVLLRGG